MKGAIAGLLLGLEMSKAGELDYDTSVMITTDEEVGQSGQLRYLSQYLQPLSGAYVFDLDSSFGYVSIAGLGAHVPVVRTATGALPDDEGTFAVFRGDSTDLLFNLVHRLLPDCRRSRNNYCANGNLFSFEDFCGDSQVLDSAVCTAADIRLVHLFTGALADGDTAAR